jgi:hypothetical protein
MPSLQESGHHHPARTQAVDFLAKKENAEKVINATNNAGDIFDVAQRVIGDRLFHTHSGDRGHVWGCDVPGQLLLTHYKFNKGWQVPGFGSTWSSAHYVKKDFVPPIGFRINKVEILDIWKEDNGSFEMLDDRPEHIVVEITGQVLRGCNWEIKVYIVKA